MSRAEAQQLPHSEEAERAVLAAVLLTNGQILAEVELREEDFYLERHQLIWRAMRELQAAGEAVDLRTLQARLEDAGAFEPIGGFAYLAGLDLDLPDIGRFHTYAGIVAERSTRRQLVLGLSEVNSGAIDGSLSAGDSMARVQELVGRLGAESSTGAADPVSLDATVEEFGDFEPPESGLLGWTTGFGRLDDLTLGLEPGLFYILGGHPGAGKSVLAKDIAVSAAKAGARVLVFSLEMPWEQWRDRILASESAAMRSPGVALRRIRTRDLGPKDSPLRLHLANTMEAVRDLPIWGDDRRGLSAEQIAASAARFDARRGVDAVIVDHIQLVRYSGSETNMAKQVGAVGLRLRELAGQLQVPVLGLSQLTDDDKVGPKWKPHLGMLRYSKELGQHADDVWFIHRPGLYSDEEEHQNRGELYVTKQRQGEANKCIHLSWLGDVTGYRSRATQEQERTAEAGGSKRYGW